MFRPPSFRRLVRRVFPVLGALPLALAFPVVSSAATLPDPSPGPPTAPLGVPLGPSLGIDLAGIGLIAGVAVVFILAVVVDLGARGEEHKKATPLTAAVPSASGRPAEDRYLPHVVPLEERLASEDESVRPEHHKLAA